LYAKLIPQGPRFTALWHIGNTVGNQVGASNTVAIPHTTVSFGYWVRRQRKALDFTQADLAHAVGCARVTVSKIEQDERRPSRQMAELLAEHLAVPTEERALFLAVANGEKAVDQLALTAQPLGPTPAVDDLPPSSLPVPTTTFVGRQEELAQLRAHLTDPACRLLTLAGPGGFGKTRLSIRLGELALEDAAHFPDGIYFVALDALSSPDLVVPAIAAVLDFTFYEQQAQTQQLLTYLADRRLLLILDNAEQILDADLVDAMLAHAPHIKLVVTSRETLNLQQEWFHPIAGLSLDAHPDSARGGADNAAQADAVALFEQSARRARPDFNLAREAAHVDRICALVGGVPLAIEMAAAWLRAMSCAQIAAELTRNLDLLTTGKRNVPARHGSVRDVFTQSWRLLTEVEQELFRKLAVFVGGFVPDAARVVADAPLWALALLVEKSMLQVDADGRYQIHALLHQFGAEKLAAVRATQADVQARHRQYYLACLAAWHPLLATEELPQALADVQADLDNIRLAWREAAAAGHLEELGKALPTLFHFLWIRGRYEEGETLAEAALAASTPDACSSQQTTTLVMLMAHRARFAAARGRQADALAILDDALTLAQTAGDRRGEAFCWYLIGGIYFEQWQRARAVDTLTRAYEMAGAVNDVAGMASAAIDLGYAYVYLVGDYATGQRLVDEGLQRFREIGDVANTAAALDKAASIRWKTGDFAGAERYYRECTDLAQRIGHRHLFASAIGGLGLVAWGTGDLDEAVEFLQQRMESMQELGHGPGVDTGLFLLSGILTFARRYDDVARLLDAYPDFSPSYFKVQAQIAVGDYAAAFPYLPQETAAMLAAENTFDLASFLIAWAMLLLSDSPLARASKQIAGLATEAMAHAAMPMPRDERIVLAWNLLSFIRQYEYCRADTRARAARLMDEHREALDVDGAGSETPTVESIEALARAVLAIRLDS
jgi:predicted ATPase/DNA-binding XRE family transcriptional regulator